MPVAWAAVAHPLSFQPIEAATFPELVKRLDAVGHTEEIALLLEGSNVFGFMKGERGLHRLLHDNMDELVNVRVFALPDGTNVGEWLDDYQEIKVDIAEGRRPAPPEEKLSVVRHYSLERQGERFIRDTRTNLRTVQVREVVEKGRLDDFILAYLELSERGVGWEDRFPPTFPF
ncbi:MAG: hypothetical protein HC915_03265 [Anaerolineae bacterium]|nr:hypothetical protein [Anaerolineae bacterium]